MPSETSRPKTGVWLIGAQGSLAATVVLGARAVARGLAAAYGLVSDAPELAALPHVPLGDLAFGGWDIAPRGLVARARALARDDAAVPEALVAKLEGDLRAVEARVRPGFADGGGPANRSRGTFVPRRERLAAAVERLGDDLDGFRREQRLDTVIVMNVAATEPIREPAGDHQRLERFRRVIQQNRRALVTPSMLYAYAALERGFPYVNFTPSIGAAVPALGELALKQHVPFYGRDGKTGETLLKSVLAPMFRARNLDVLSWEGFNILGGGDGRVLADRRHQEAKVRSKARVLAGTLGYAPHTSVGIEYVPSLGNWKTAWDFVHFRGFLGTKMSLQFIWQGCDSILAAPLVLDLARLAEFAQRRGEAGPMTHLACFFKDPLDVDQHAFPEQCRLLTDYVARHATGRNGRPARPPDRPARRKPRGR
jgi:myo-inositol-1-phosphate synthase